MAAPQTTATLTWRKDLQFDAQSGQTEMVIDSRGVAGPSPVEALAVAVAGCMAIDVVDIVTKGRHPLKGLSVALTAERAPEPPRCFVKLDLHFTVDGAVPTLALDRALRLSRDKYCSVWQSLRKDIPLTTTYEVRP
jgi:putative redox protein